MLLEIAVRTTEHEVAVFNDTTVEDLGTLTLRGVRTTGQVLLLARDAVRSGHVRVDGLTVDAVDLRGRPYGWTGVNNLEVMQGGFTLWNMQPDPAAEITAELLDISAGSAAGARIRGLGRRIRRPSERDRPWERDGRRHRDGVHASYWGDPHGRGIIPGHPTSSPAACS
jgi:hypothetical protein